MLRWKRPIRIIDSNSWSCADYPIKCWSYCMRLSYKTGCLLSKPCSASVHFCPFFQRVFVFSILVFGPAGGALCMCTLFCKMLDFVCWEAVVYVWEEAERVSVKLLRSYFCLEVSWNKVLEENLMG